MKVVLGKIFLLGLSIIIIVILLIYFTTLKVNLKDYINYVLNLKSTIMNEKLIGLTNANTIYNLPNLIIKTNNPDIERLLDCKGKLKFMGNYTEDDAKLKNYRDVCKHTCGGSASLLLVENDKDYVYENKFVEPGVYCTVGQKECNTNTGYVVATVNSTTCISKYPRMFGGPKASTIIACSDSLHPSTGSILWDYANNEEVDPTTVLMTHEDELLPDGQYRFRCKFNETDNGNPYIPHPLDRFHPIKDKCNDSIYRADYSVHALVNEHGWSCDCGDFDVTRVKHLDKNNDKSICTSCFWEKLNDANYQIPYICYNENSPYSYTKNNVPCIEYKDSGNSCTTVLLNVKVSDDYEYAINTKKEGEIQTSDLATNYVVYKN